VVYPKYYFGFAEHYVGSGWRLGSLAPLTSIALGQATGYGPGMYWITQRVGVTTTGISTTSAGEALVRAEGLLRDGDIVISRHDDIITLEQLRLDAGEADT
jgi:hypothetical protein